MSDGWYGTVQSQHRLGFGWQPGADGRVRIATTRYIEDSEPAPAGRVRNLPLPLLAGEIIARYGRQHAALEPADHLADIVITLARRLRQSGGDVGVTDRALTAVCMSPGEQ